MGISTPVPRIASAGAVRMLIVVRDRRHFCSASEGESNGGGEDSPITVSGRPSMTHRPWWADVAAVRRGPRPAYRLRRRARRATCSAGRLRSAGTQREEGADDRSFGVDKAVINMYWRSPRRSGTTWNLIAMVVKPLKFSRSAALDG
jgi:plasmid stabilization system protein ParE